MSFNNLEFLDAIELMKTDAQKYQVAIRGLKLYNFFSLSGRERFAKIHNLLIKWVARMKRYAEQYPLEAVVHSQVQTIRVAQVRRLMFQNIQLGLSAYKVVFNARPAFARGVDYLQSDIVPLIASHLTPHDFCRFKNCCTSVRSSLQPLMHTLDISFCSSFPSQCEDPMVGTLVPIFLRFRCRRFGGAADRMQVRMMLVDESSRRLKGTMERFEELVALKPNELVKTIVRFLKVARNVRIHCRVSMVTDSGLWHLCEASQPFRVRAARVRKRDRNGQTVADKE